jgi:hypothetical protein
MRTGFVASGAAATPPLPRRPPGDDGPQRRCGVATIRGRLEFPIAERSNQVVNVIFNRADAASAPSSMRFWESVSALGLVAWTDSQDRMDQRATIGSRVNKSVSRSTHGEKCHHGPEHVRDGCNHPLPLPTNPPRPTNQCEGTLWGQPTTSFDGRGSTHGSMAGAASKLIRQRR